ncbi:MAG: DNA-3-methyladenine glycosylase I [Microbacteriaceae bacterium]|nr:DNA-3-methyladenine glycosylase I [Cryobacterium sp.]MCC7128193.1 DNA-3-methyladenine glycosylase I [Microbacteriaceae bacterium]
MSRQLAGEPEPIRPDWANSDPLLQDYYDNEWGFPVTDERGVFERISLEAFQSGLSWLTILRKRPAFRQAFAGFDPDAVAAFSEADVERLLNDEGIVRNQLKIRATMQNARATVKLRETVGLAELVWSFKPEPDAVKPGATWSKESAELSKELRRSGFSFVGPTTMYALMEAIGLVNSRLS